MAAFRTLDDIEVAKALLDRAEAWLRSRGMKRVNGPMSLNVNQEVGVLVEGFDENLALASRNLPNVGVCEAREADPVNLIRYEHVLATVPALRQLEERLA